MIMATEFTVQFIHNRDTKGAHRYHELVPTSDTPEGEDYSTLTNPPFHIGALYFRKQVGDAPTFPANKTPERLSVTVSYE